MKRYIITEQQLQNIFENLEYDKLKEMDNQNYPPGSDTSTAPWNYDDSKNSTPIKPENNNISLAVSDRREFLFKDNSTGSFLYTTKDNFEDNGDIFEILHDYLEIPQEPSSSEDGTQLGDTDDWKDYVSDNELGEAIALYANHNNTTELGVTESIDEWETGQYRFLEITKNMSGMPEINGVIYSTKILSILKQKN